MGHRRGVGQIETCTGYYNTGLAKQCTDGRADEDPTNADYTRTLFWTGSLVSSSSWESASSQRRKFFARILSR